MTTAVKMKSAAVASIHVTVTIWRTPPGASAGAAGRRSGALGVRRRAARSRRDRGSEAAGTRRDIARDARGAKVESSEWPASTGDATPFGRDRILAAGRALVRRALHDPDARAVGRLAPDRARRGHPDRRPDRLGEDTRGLSLVARPSAPASRGRRTRGPDGGRVRLAL